MKRWLGKSLKRKLTLFLLFVLLLPLVCTGVISYQIATSVTEEKAKQSGMNTLKQIKDKLAFVIQDVENMSIFLIGEKDIQLYLSNDVEDVARYSLIIGTLTNLAFSKKYISNITITPKNGNPELSNSTILKSGLLPLLEHNEDVYRSKPKWWSSLYENQTTEGLKRVISLVRHVRNFYTFQEVGRLSISVDQTEIEHFIKEAGWETSGHVLLLDKDNQIISSSGNPNWLSRSLLDYYPQIDVMDGDNGILSYGSGRDQQTILYNTIPGLDWKLVGFIPTRVYTAQNTYVLTVTAFVTGIALVLAIGLMLYYLQWVTRPLTKLTLYLKDLNPDDVIPQYEVRSSDEVGQLIHSYNKLSDRIGRLKSQVQLNEAKKKEADIQALQAQINPHFLYNTLSSIHWMALMNKDKQIAEMVGALSDFLRFSLNKGEEYCSVQQEIAHVHNYAHIQSIRFPDQFEIEFFIDPAMLQMPMLKLLLQPLIENSLIHGIQRKKDKGNIYVHGERLENSMRFVVEDTGVGIEEGKLAEIRRLFNSVQAAHSDSQLQQMKSITSGYAKPPGTSSYGLLNVHQRLQLHYGAESGLSIYSEVNVGTKISFIIPLEIGG